MRFHRMGQQVLGELTFCERDKLDDPELLETLLREAASSAGATLLSVHVHRFQPHGVSGVAILAESHLAVHTWPELGYAAVDSFTCGDHVDPVKALERLEQGFGARCTSSMELYRGMHPSVPAMDSIDAMREGADSHRAPGAT